MEIGMKDIPQFKSIKVKSVMVSAHRRTWEEPPGRKKTGPLFHIQLISLLTLETGI